MPEAPHALAIQLESLIQSLLKEFGYGPGTINVANLIAVTNYLGWDYEDRDLRESVTTVDSNLRLVRPPTPFNHRTLGGVLRYQLGYEYAQSGLPAFPEPDTTALVRLHGLLDEIGNTLEQIRALSPDGKLHNEYLPESIFTPVKRD
jgi:hypothetical protein